MQENIKLKDIIELDIKRMGINGEGIGYFQKLAVFVDTALPGEKILAQITEVYENRVVAKLLKILVRSNDRETPFCPVFDDCGGCSTQHFNYQAMLQQKKEILVKSFDRYSKFIPKYVFQDAMGMENPMHYRNKAALPFKKVDGKNMFGMFARNSNRFIPIIDCGVQHQKINEVFQTITSLMDKYKIDAYDEDAKTGFITHGIIRVSENLDQMQVSFVVPERVVELFYVVDDLVEIHPEIVSVFEVVNKDLKKQTFFTEESYKLYGTHLIKENLDGKDYMLKPDVFFQLNTTQADKFYKKMVELANFKPTDIAIDAHAGIAPVSHYIHHLVKKVYAIEYDKDTSDSAIMSLALNNIHNVEVINKNLNEAFLSINEKIDVVLLDPPRSGLHQQTINDLLKLKPGKIIYASCNPSTLAKDISILSNQYKIISITPIDMFPFTSLVESITLLEIK